MAKTTWVTTVVPNNAPISLIAFIDTDSSDNLRRYAVLAWGISAVPEEGIPSTGHHVEPIICDPEILECVNVTYCLEHRDGPVRYFFSDTRHSGRMCETLEEATEFAREYLQEVRRQQLARAAQKKAATT